MSRTTTTFLMLVACVAMTVPAWAYTVGCPDECRNGDFEVDLNDFDGCDYDATGTVVDNNWEEPDHWSWSDDDDFDYVEDNGPSLAGDHAISFVNTDAEASGWVWQCVDETLALWSYDDGWDHGSNTCWREGISKEIRVEYDYKFTVNDEHNQFLNVWAYAWAPEGEDPASPDTDPVDFSPTAVPEGWVFVRKWLNQSSDSTIGGWDTNTHNTTIRTYQPRYICWAWEFVQPDYATLDVISLDNVEMYGECAPVTPELSTWLLLAATGAFGGIVRRRRKG